MPENRSERPACSAVRFRTAAALSGLRRAGLLPPLRILILHFLVGIFCSSGQAQAPNFYTDVARPKKTPTPTKKPEKNSPTPTPAAKAAASAKTPVPKNAAEPTKTPQPARTVTAQQKSSLPTQPATPRRIPRGLDPYGLSATFAERWDLLHFVITPAEALRYRIESTRLKATRLARATAKLEKNVERREKNVRNAAVAAYLLGHANSGPAYLGNDVTLPHLVAVRATLKHDLQERERELTVYEILRSAENAAVAQLRQLEKDTAVKDAYEDLANAGTGPAGVTRSPADEYRRLTEALVQERGLPAETEEALHSAELLASARWRRETLASLAPALPDIAPDPGGDQLPRDEEPPPVRAKRPQPTGTKDDPTPPLESAVVIRTSADRLIRAAADGTVAFAGPFRGVGHLVVLEHPRGLFSVYENLETVRVSNSQAVRAGQIIGEAVGASDVGEGWIRFQVRRGVDVVQPGELLGKVEAASVVAPRAR